MPAIESFFGAGGFATGFFAAGFVAAFATGFFAAGFFTAALVVVFLAGAAFARVGDRAAPVADSETISCIIFLCSAGIASIMLVIIRRSSGSSIIRARMTGSDRSFMCRAIISSDGAELESAAMPGIFE